MPWWTISFWESVFSCSLSYKRRRNALTNATHTHRIADCGNRRFSVFLGCVVLSCVFWWLPTWMSEMKADRLHSEPKAIVDLLSDRFVVKALTICERKDSTKLCLPFLRGNIKINGAPKKRTAVPDEVHTFESSRILAAQWSKAIILFCDVGLGCDRKSQGLWALQTLGAVMQTWPLLSRLDIKEQWATTRKLGKVRTNPAIGTPGCAEPAYIKSGEAGGVGWCRISTLG